MRLAPLAFVAAACAGLASVPAFAEPIMVARMPVVAAYSQGDTVQVRLVRPETKHVRGAPVRILEVEGFDASGRSIGVHSTKVTRRSAYATVVLPAGLQSADRISVSVR